MPIQPVRKLSHRPTREDTVYSVRSDLMKLSKNIYADLAAQDLVCGESIDAFASDLANLTTMVNDLGNSLMEAGAQRKKDYDSTEATFEILQDQTRDLNDRMRRVEKRLDNAATFGNGSIQGAYRVLNEQQLQINALRRSADEDRAEFHQLLNAINDALKETQTRPADDDAEEWASEEGRLVVPSVERQKLDGAAEGAMSHVPAPDGSRVLVIEEQEPPVPTLNHNDADFLRYLVTEKYSFGQMVREGLLRIADRIDEAVA